MSEKDRMPSQGYAGPNMNGPPSAPSYEEAMRYPTLPPMESMMPQPVHPVILQPQPMFHVNPQPPVVQPHGEITSKC